MVDKRKKFIEEYERICRSYQMLIEPCGWHNLIISDQLSKKDFEEKLAEEIKHFTK